MLDKTDQECMGLMDSLLCGICKVAIDSSTTRYQSVIRRFLWLE